MGAAKLEPIRQGWNLRRAGTWHLKIVLRCYAQDDGVALGARIGFGDAAPRPSFD